MTSKEFVDWLYPEACKLDINPVFVVAQAALETGWGKHTIGKYNLFGITKGSWTGKTLLVTTTEVHSTTTVKYNSPEEILDITPLGSGKFKYKVIRQFRDYESLEQCLKDHFDVLRKPHFVHAWRYKNDPVKFVEALQSGKMKYATDPNYAAVMGQMFKTVGRLLK